MADPDKVTLRNVIEFELLEQADPTLLRETLLHFREHLQQRGLELDDFSPDHQWLCQLHEILQSVDLDPRLQEVLITIGDLADDMAHEEAITASKRAQMDLPLFATGSRANIADVGANVVDVGFRMFLEDPRGLQRLHALIQTRAVKSFVVFSPKVPLPLADQLDDARVRRLEKHLGAHFAQRNRTGYCQIVVADSDEEISFSVVHGQPPRTHSIIVNRDERSRTSIVRAKHDLIVFQKETCRLLVNAQHAYEQDLYRRTFGHAFFGSSEHFTAKTILSGQPLVELGSEAVSVAGIQGVSWVRLRELHLLEEDGLDTLVATSGPHVTERLDMPEFKEQLLRGSIQFFRLEMKLKKHRRPVMVKIKPPNRLVHDRRLGPDQVRRFLIERGFLSLTPLTSPVRSDQTQ